MFPRTRLRRLRRTAWLRDLVRETAVRPEHLVAPLFVVPGSRIRKEIPALPGQFHLSADRLVEEAERLADLGIRAILLFGKSDRKDARGSSADARGAIIPAAIGAVRKKLGDRIGILADVCLCAYTSSGHCGILDRAGRVANDPTVARLAATSVAYARAGADGVAPSDMMDGRVGAIRTALDAAGLRDAIILSYAAKYASAFYGPFRGAAGSAPPEGEDRKGYQMDPANIREALREIALDVGEGADIVMVKPVLAYLDVIRAARKRFDVPVAAYSVSGEYAMVEAAAVRGWIDGRAARDEILTAIRRAGADLIITYWAGAFARDARR